MKKELYAAFLLAAENTQKAEQTVQDAFSAVLSGADGVVLLDRAESEAGHEAFFGALRSLRRLISVPVLAGGRTKRLEDVKKYLYAGANGVILTPEEGAREGILDAAGKRFGEDHLWLLWEESQGQMLVCGEASLSLLPAPATGGDSSGETAVPDMTPILSAPGRSGAALLAGELPLPDFMQLKQLLSDQGVETERLVPAFTWDDFKKDPQGLVPVVVQDADSLEVLMVAWMNKEAFDRTILTGRMHYWSRSRQSLWLKGETSGHFQFVRSIDIDCDADTLLAKVFQIGAACHTGNRSCFYRQLAALPGEKRNPHKVFEDVYQVILDRKAHPKEGSYTNYLFDKGIDKILKKVGEEASEIIIAAKNPDPEEVKYEISDFLYHVMVLMAVKNVTWEDITEELANR